MHSPLLSAIAGDEAIEALLSDEAQLGAMLDVERALARAEAEVGLITAQSCGAVVAAIDGYSPAWPDLVSGMAKDGVVVPALVKQLRSLVAEPFARDVHLGATSQDVVDTSLILQLAKIMPIILDRLQRLVARLYELSTRFGGNKVMAHTRMQAALEFTVADKLRTWIEPLERHRDALSGMRRSLLVVQLGGPVGDRSSFKGRGDDVARHLARLLDLGAASPWHSDRESLVAFGNRLALLAGTLGKIGIDIGLMAQSEVGSITLEGGGGSSAMPHKSNPVNAEILVALARHVAGLSGSLGYAMVHEGERSGAAWTLEWLTLPPLLVTTGAGLRIADRLLDQVSF